MKHATSNFAVFMRYGRNQMKRKLLVAAAGIAGGFLLFAGPAGAMARWRSRSQVGKL